MEGASYRASLLKSVVDEVGLHPDADRIRERIDPEVLGQIGSASRAEFLSVEYIMQLDVAIADALGDDGYWAFWRDFASHATRISILRPIADGVLRLFGSPGSLLKLYPRSFALVGRGLGKMSIKVDDRAKTCAVTLSGAGPMSRPDLFGKANAASIEGMFTLVGHRGVAHGDWSDADTGLYRFDASWE